MQILKKTEQGKAILDAYMQNGMFNPEDRTNLVHKIIQFFIESDIPLSVSRCRLLAEQITSIFPTEQQVDI